MKKHIFSFLAFVLTLSVFVVPVCASQSAECLSWYIKKQGRNTPLFPKEAEEIKQYDAYYIDEKCLNSEEGKRIYITFDAGYENGNIEKILDTLKKENVPAAFFLLDNIILKNPELVKRMSDEGHLVCNHTRNHKNLSSCSSEEISDNLRSLEKIYEEQTGEKMSKYFRFPEGSYSISSLSTIQSLGYKTIFWSFGYEDWDNNRQMSEEKAMKKILQNTHNGEVLLLHPTSETNARILPSLIQAWRGLGYSFGTLDELVSEES